MALTLYPNLPGTRVETTFNWVKTVSSATNATKAVIIFGTAVDGPVMEPVRLTGVSSGVSLFGDLDSVDTASKRKTLLARGIREASEAGCNDIYCVRVSGKSAELSPAYTGANLILKALYGGEKYGNSAGTDGIGVLISENAINIVDINGIAYSVPFVDGVTTYQQLIEAINYGSNTYKVKAESRGESDPTVAVRSHKPGIITGSVAGPYNIVPGTNDTLKFASVDGDTNSSAGFTVSFPGTKGSIVNASAKTNNYFIMRGVNDVISLNSTEMSEGVFEDVCILLDTEDSKFFTGSELAARLQTVINSNSTLTGSGSLTFTVAFATSPNSKFTISVPTADPQVDEFALDYSRSTIAQTLGYTSSFAAGASAVTAVAVDFNVIQNGNDRFSINEDCQYARDIVVGAGYYTIANLVTAINTAITASGSSVVCSNNAGAFTFTSNRYGSQSSVGVSNGSTDFLPVIGYNGTLTATQGTGFAKFLDVATSREVADRITSASNQVNAIPYYVSESSVGVKIYSALRGSGGSIVTSTNSTSTINATLGIVQSRTYSGSEGNLPVTLPSSADSTFKVKYMAGGDSEVGLTDDQYMDYLATAYEIFEEKEGPNIAVALGANIFVDKLGNINLRNAYNLARFCMKRTNIGNYTHGVICMEPIKNPNQTNINVRAQAHCSYDFAINYKSGYCTSSNVFDDYISVTNGVSSPVNIRAFLTVISGPEGIFYQNTVGTYVGSMEAAYAGSATALNLDQSTTEKAIKGPIGLYYKYGKGQLNDLVGARFLTFYAEDGVVKSVLDVTYDEKGATYDNLFTFSLASAVVNGLQKVFKPYYGLAFNAVYKNAMGSAAKAFMDNMVQMGYLENYTYSLENVATASRMAECIAKVSIQTPGELKRVNLIVNMTNQISS